MHEMPIVLRNSIWIIRNGYSSFWFNNWLADRILAQNNSVSGDPSFQLETLWSASGWNVEWL